MSFRIFLLAAFVCFNFGAYGKEVKLESLQAAYTYKFTNYIEWPSQPDSTFIVGVLDNQELYVAMKDIFEGKLIGSKSASVINISKLDKGTNYQILCVNKIDSILANEIKQLQRNGLLLISQSDSFHEDALINFYIDTEEKLRFEINLNKATQNGLKINSRLLNLSKSSK